MATVTRQPFAPLNEARLQTLTSLKNRQNAISNTSPVKRKASDVSGSDNSENVDPILFSKRAKGADGSPSKDSFIKPSTFFLKSDSVHGFSAPIPSQTANPRPRSVLTPRSPAAKLITKNTRSTPLSAPAGRSPHRKRSGLLSSKKRPGTRLEAPVFGLPAGPSAVPFSLSDALKGTISRYTNQNDAPASKQSSSTSGFTGLHEPELKSSWFFDIHEDTEAEEAANMLQHGACVLDISSDEESERRRQRERAEGKENIAPLDDISQTSYPRAARHTASTDEMVIEKERSPLGEMDPTQYYSEGCDENSVVTVADDEDEETAAQYGSQFIPGANFSASIQAGEEADSMTRQEPVEEESASIEELIQKADNSVPSAAVFEPIEGTGESFEVWESSSAKDETESVTGGC